MIGRLGGCLDFWQAQEQGRRGARIGIWGEGAWQGGDPATTSMTANVISRYRQIPILSRSPDQPKPAVAVADVPPG